MFAAALVGGRDWGGGELSQVKKDPKQNVF